MSKQVWIVSLSMMIIAGGWGCKKEAAREDAAPVEPVVVQQEVAPRGMNEEDGVAPDDTLEEVPAETLPPEPARIDHATFDTLLKAHVDPQTGLVDYEGLKAKEAELDAYLTGVIAEADLEALSREERFAFYINAYNAYTLKLILGRYPKIGSIRDYKEPWKMANWQVADETLSLDQIEHEKLRPVYKDPRIHFAVNCASIGCPPLRAEAYVGDRLEEQLEAATRQTLNDTKYVQLKGGKLYLSKILEWYGGDFTNAEYAPNAPSVAEFVARYNDSEELDALVAQKGGKTPVRYKEYDWKLNRQK